jgi:hypothetical protein
MTTDIVKMYPPSSPGKLKWPYSGVNTDTIKTNFVKSEAAKFIYADFTTSI